MRSHVETSESHTQVLVASDGVLAVHDNVVFKANTAASYGGAVILASGIGFDLHVVVLCDTL